MLIVLYRDYESRPQLDRYDPAAIDEGDYDELSIEGRQAAERVMRKRDRQEALATGRMRPELLYG